MALFTVRDTASGRTVTCEGDAFEWSDNNWSCDCNREGLFGEFTPSSYCLGTKRYVVVLVDPMPEGYSLEDFNVGYPDQGEV